jgi:hypothetical protein
MVQAGSTLVGKQERTLAIDRVVALPSKMYIDATLGGDIKVRIAVDGKTGWQAAPNEKKEITVVDLTGGDLATIDFERWREPDLILLKGADPAAKVTVAPDATINEKPQSVVKVRSPINNIEVSIYIDKKTKLVSRMTYAEGGQSQVDDFDDYKDVSGIKVAHKRSSVGAGRTTKMEIKSMEIDPKVDPKLWEKPKAP